MENKEPEEVIVFEEGEMLTLVCLNIREPLWFNVLLALMIWRRDKMSKILSMTELFPVLTILKMFLNILRSIIKIPLP